MILLSVFDLNCRLAVTPYVQPAIMSGRILSQRLTPLLRRGLLARHVHLHSNRTGGLLRIDSTTLRGRPWPVGSNSIHNVPAVRSISFARILPRLALKLARLPAMFGGAMIAGVAYIQYQAAREFSLQATMSHQVR